MVQNKANMFYAEDFTPEIRQGDVFEGLVNIGITPSKFLTPDILNKEHNPCFSVNLGFSYAAIITPCCDIQKREYLAFCPIVPLEVKIRENEFFIEDPTRVNIKVTPEHMVPKLGWEKMSASKKAERIEAGKRYAFTNNFIFEKHENIFADYVMIDFNFIFNIKRSALGSANEKLIPNRVLQLSYDTRRILRLKLADYFFRDPDKCVVKTQ